MHKIVIPEYALRLAKERGSSGRFLDSLDPARCALLVVDMQNGFVAPGAPVEVPHARDIVPAINRLAQAIRHAGGRVVWIQTSFRDEASRWSVWFSQRLRPEASAAMISAFTQGAKGYELYAELQTAPGDLHIVKTRFSPFVEGSSNLHAILKIHGIDSLLIAGTVSNTCCESTARDAMMLNFKVIFLSDANAARTDDEHNATLGNMLQVFADVASVDEVVGSLTARAHIA